MAGKQTQTLPPEARAGTAAAESATTATIGAQRRVRRFQVEQRRTATLNGGDMAAFVSRYLRILPIQHRDGRTSAPAAIQRAAVATGASALDARRLAAARE